MKTSAMPDPDESDEDAVERLRLQDQLSVLRRLAQLKKSNGLAFYKPHPKQQLFHRAAGYKRRYLRTGNRFGKSTCGAAEDCAYARGERAWEEGKYRHLGIPKRSTKGLILVADWDKAREIFTNVEDGAAQGKLFRLLPKSAVKGVHKNQSGEIDTIFVESVWGGLSSIHLDTVKSFLSNPMGQESSDWDWIHVDEPIPEDMWIANSRGLMDRDGSAWFTCTPLKYMWINDYFIPTKQIREEFVDGFGNDEASKWVMTGSTFDNTTLDSKAIKMFMDDLPEADRQARIHGRPKALSGAIYSEFDYSRHVYHEPPPGWVDVDTPPMDYTIRISIDPHPKTPHAVLFAATAPTGEVFFFNEIFRHTLLDDLIDEILEKVKGRSIHLSLCDPYAFIQNPADGSIWADVFWRRGIMVQPATKQLTSGIQEVKRQLKKEKNWFFSSSLATAFSEFDRYVWDPKREKPIDAHDHVMECLYRLALTGLNHVPDDEMTALTKTVPDLDWADMEIKLGDISNDFN